MSTETIPITTYPETQEYQSTALAPYTGLSPALIDRGEVPQDASNNLEQVVRTVAEALSLQQDFTTLHESISRLLNDEREKIETRRDANAEAATEWQTIATKLYGSYVVLLNNQLQTDLELTRAQSLLPEQQTQVDMAEADLAKKVEAQQQIEKDYMDQQVRQQRNAAAKAAFVEPFWPQKEENEPADVYKARCDAATQQHLAENPERARLLAALDSELEGISHKASALNVAFDTAGSEVAEAQAMVQRATDARTMTRRIIKSLESRKHTEDDSATKLSTATKELLEMATQARAIFGTTHVVNRLKEEQVAHILDSLRGEVEKVARTNPTQFSAALGMAEGTSSNRELPATPSPRVVQTLMSIRQTTLLKQKAAEFSDLTNDAYAQSRMRVETAMHGFMGRAQNQATFMETTLLPRLKNLGERVRLADKARNLQQDVLSAREGAHEKESGTLQLMEQEFAAIAEQLLKSHTLEQGHSAFLAATDEIARATHDENEQSRLGALSATDTESEDWKIQQMDEVASSYGRSSLYDSNLSPVARPYPGVQDFLLPKSAIDKYIAATDDSDPYVAFARLRLGSPEAFQPRSQSTHDFERQQGIKRKTIIDLYNESTGVVPILKTHVKKLEDSQTERHANIARQKQVVSAKQTAVREAEALMAQIDQTMHEKLMPKHEEHIQTYSLCLEEWFTIRAEVADILHIDPMKVGSPSLDTNTDRRVQSATDAIRMANDGEEPVLPPFEPNRYPKTSASRQLFHGFVARVVKAATSAKASSQTLVIRSRS